MRPADLGSKMCMEFDTFASKAKERGSETWDALLHRLHATYVKGDEVAAFDALLWVLKSKRDYVYQNLAGTLLNQFEIPCRIGLDEFTEILLHNFNASAKETVRYLVRSFGKDAVKAKVSRLRESDLTDAERRTVDCLRYWLGEHPGAS